MTALPASSPAEPPARHVWLPDGESLCARAERDDGSLAAQRVCSPCLLLVGTLRRDAADLLAAGLPIEPPTATEAWRSLAGTSWGQRFPDVASFGGEELDAATRFDAPLLALDLKEYP